MLENQGKRGYNMVRLKLDTPLVPGLTQLQRETILMFIKNRGIFILPARKNRSHAIHPRISSKFKIRIPKGIPNIRHS